MINEQLDELLTIYGDSDDLVLTEHTHQKVHMLGQILDGQKQALDDWHQFYEMLAEKFNISDEDYLELVEEFYSKGE